MSRPLARAAGGAFALGATAGTFTYAAFGTMLAHPNGIGLWGCVFFAMTGGAACRSIWRDRL